MIEALSLVPFKIKAMSTIDIDRSDVNFNVAITQSVDRSFSIAVGRHQLPASVGLCSNCGRWAMGGRGGEGSSTISAALISKCDDG